MGTRGFSRGFSKGFRHAISGALAATEERDTAALAGAVRDRATLSATEPTDLATFGDQARDRATLLATERADTASFAVTAQGQVVPLPQPGGFVRGAYTLPKKTTHTSRKKAKGRLMAMEREDTARFNATGKTIDEINAENLEFLLLVA